MQLILHVKLVSELLYKNQDRLVTTRMQVFKSGQAKAVSMPITLLLAGELRYCLQSIKSIFLNLFQPFQG